MKKIIIAMLVILGIVLGGILYTKAKENKIETYNTAAEKEITAVAKESFRGYEKGKDGMIIGYYYEDTSTDVAVIRHRSYSK